MKETLTIKNMGIKDIGERIKRERDKHKPVEQKWRNKNGDTIDTVLDAITKRLDIMTKRLNAMTKRIDDLEKQLEKTNKEE